MKQKIYQVDAFTKEAFSGNPAGVCPLENWISDDLMQKIATENNLSETAFYVKNGNRYELRWFTPNVEVDLCGHATLATAFILFNIENHPGDIIEFYSPRSGILTVTKNADLLTLNFPTDLLQEVSLSKELLACFDLHPTKILKGKTDYLFVYKNESEITDILPVFEKINQLDARGVIITAEGNSVDFVSRFFGPQSGINEDPVTGSAHTTLTPYWYQQLGKNEFSTIQLSARKGYLTCKYLGERVEISGQARLYMKGEIFL